MPAMAERSASRAAQVRAAARCRRGSASRRWPTIGASRRLLRCRPAVWVRVGSGHVLDGDYCDVVIVRAIADEGFEQDVDVLVR